jgi:hypothetical protein
VSALSETADALEEQLAALLDEEQERLEAERDFLLKVVDGTTDGVSIEDPSSELTRELLNGYISRYLPVDEEK